MAASTSGGKISDNAIRHQHEQLKSLLEAIGNRFQHENNPSRNLVSLLNALAAHLQMHFELEESDGYFTSLTSKRPDVSATVEQLLREHVEMLKSVDSLVTLAREDLNTGQDTFELEKKFLQLREQLDKHEHTENQLIQDCYNTDLGTKD